MSAPVTAADVFGRDRDDERLERLGEGHYVLNASELSTDLEVDHVRRERHELRAELTVHCGLAGVQTVRNVLFQASVNLSSIRDRESIARTLQQRTGVAKIETARWSSLVDELCIRVTEAERHGDPAVRLCDVPRSVGAHRSLSALGFRLPERLPAMIFGDGDSLKTMTLDAIALDLARQGVPVGIVDAEMTVDDHAERIARLALGAPVPEHIAYLSCARPLIHERDRIAEMVHAHQLRYLMFDSVAFLCHDKPEYSDAATSYDRAAKSFGVGTFHVAHTNKGDTSDQKPFGSTFWFNAMRAIWYAKRAEAAVANVSEIGFYARKYNQGARPGAHALRFSFDAETTSVVPVEAASIESLATNLPIKERVKHVLRTGARTIPEIGVELPDTDVEALSRTIRRYSGDKAKFQLFVKLPDGRFANVSRRDS